MKKHFYTHLVTYEELFVEMEQLDLSEKEKKELAVLVDSHMHHKILDVVLSELSDADKKLLLEHLSHDHHDKVWDHLKSRVENIEDKIKKTAEELKADLKKDIHEAKSLHGKKAKEKR